MVHNKPHSIEAKRKMSKSSKGQIPWKKEYKEYECKYCKKIFEDNVKRNRKFCSGKCRQLSGISVNTGRTRFKKGQIPWNIGMKGIYKNPGKSISNKKLWGNEEWAEKQIKLILKGLIKRPTSFEKQISELCIDNNLPYIYTGDGKFLINFKNPDFVNKENKVAIEVFYSWFKIRDYGSVENYKKFCRKKYHSAGWKVIFIDETEIDNKDLCVIKLNKFLELKGGKII